jgi:hypothetical protein
MIVANCGVGVHLIPAERPPDLQEISIILPQKLQRISKLLILKQVII